MRSPVRFLPAALVAASLISTGCSGPDEPVRTVSDSTLVEVLMDLHLAGARRQVDAKASPGLRDSVLALHGLDSTSFLEAMAWYEAHPEEYVAVYGTVVDRLAEEREP